MLSSSTCIKNIWCFLANVFCYNISSGDCFHKHDIDNLIYMIIHVKQTVGAYQCQQCRKCFFFFKWESQNTCKKSPKLFLVLIWRFQHFRQQNPKLKLMATYSGNHSLELNSWVLLMPGLLKRALKHFKSVPY